MTRERRVWLVSACLLGQRCRYDGRAAADDARERALACLDDDDEVVPVCPEVAGGLGTPRVAARLHGGDGGAVLDHAARVVDEDGRDVSEAFRRGAAVALEAARAHGATHACLKARSPSCGAGQVHREQGLSAGDGVTTAALRRAGLTVLTDEDCAGGGRGR